MFILSIIQIILLLFTSIVVTLMYLQCRKTNEKYSENCYGMKHDGQRYMEKPYQSITTYGTKSKWPNGGAVIYPYGPVQKRYMQGEYQAAV